MELINMPINLQDFIYLVGVALIGLLLTIVIYFLRKMVTKLEDLEVKFQRSELRAITTETNQQAFKDHCIGHSARLENKLDKHGVILNTHNEKLIKHGIEILALKSKTSNL